MAVWVVLAVIALRIAAGAGEAGKAGGPNGVELLSQVLPQFRPAVDEDGTSVFRFTYPLKMRSFVDTTETTSVYSRWNVKADAVRRLIADLNSNGREEVYLAFETQIAFAQDHSSAVARWLCLRGFEKRSDEKDNVRWQPLMIERNDKPHFADKIERFEIVDLGGLKALCLQNDFTDAQATPRSYFADFALYLLRGQILVPILETRIAQTHRGDGGGYYRWQREVEFRAAKGSRMKEIHIAEARKLRHSETSADWLPGNSTVRLAKDPVPGIYRWIPAQLRYIKWE